MIVDIVSEPLDDTYRLLLSKCREYSSHLLLIIRNLDDLSPDAMDLLDKIEPWCTSKEKKSEWPGTTMKNFLATVCSYRSDTRLVAECQRAATGLYQWVQPELLRIYVLFVPMVHHC